MLAMNVHNHNTRYASKQNLDKPKFVPILVNKQEREPVTFSEDNVPTNLKDLSHFSKRIKTLFTVWATVLKFL